MKKLNLYFLAILFSAGFVACENNNDNDEPSTGYGQDMTEIINDYVDRTVLSTYEDLKNKAWALYEATEKLTEANGLTDANIQLACDAWRATRIPWEQSEAFLYGPAELKGFDPMLDSWPLDQAGMDNILKGTPLKNEEGEEYYDEGALYVNVRGFHTIEYLLFTQGKARTVAQIGNYEGAVTEITKKHHLLYLSAVTKALRNDCINLWGSWAGAEVMTEDRDIEAMEEIEVSFPERGWAWQFKNAGTAGSSYLSKDEAIDEIVEGCKTISEEVGDQKIGGPNDLAKAGKLADAVLQVESWYSYNSLTDYKNNIQSIRNSYLGGREGNRGKSLSSYVSSKNPDLDAKIKEAIDEAEAAINAIPAPFRDNLTGSSVDHARTACANLTDTMLEILKLKK